MYLENAVHESTKENNDRNYDRIIPYMVSAVPTLQFADSTSAVLPEFYEEYPIFVSTSDYERVQDKYHTIYKIYDEVTSEIQLIPEGSIHEFQSDIVFIDVYSVVKESCTNLLKERVPLDDLTSDAYTIDKSTGILTLDDSHPSVLEMNEILQANKEEYGDDAYIVLEIKVEKYRSLDDLGDLTSEQVNEISTMQFVHSKLLEYCYQYTLAKQTQERLDEIAYTTYVTVVSTIIVLPISYGLGSIFSGTSLASVVKNVNIMSLYKAASTVFGEALEELYIDPWIEAFFSHMTKEWGWELWSQVFVTTFMESIRETIMGGVPKVAAQVYVQAHASRMASSTNQDIMMDMQESSRELKAQRRSQAVKIASSVLSGLMLFAGAIMPGFSSSSFMTGVATAFVVGGTSVDDIGNAISSYLYTDPSQRDGPRSKGLLARLRERLINRRATDPRGKAFVLQNTQYPDMDGLTVREILNILSTTTYLGEQIYLGSSGSRGAINEKVRSLIMAKVFAGLPLNSFEDAIISMTALLHGWGGPSEKQFNKILDEELSRRGDKVVFEKREDIIIAQLQHYSRTGEKLYSYKDIIRVIGGRRPKTYVTSYIQDLFHTSLQGAKAIYEMAFGKMSISYHSLKRACERADFELLTTPTEWFILVQNIEFINRDAFLFPKHVSGKRALQYLYVLVKCKNDHIGAKTVYEVLHSAKPFTCKGCVRYEHFKKAGLAKGFMLISSREEFDEAIGKALEVGEKTGLAVLEWRHLVDGCNHQFEYDFRSMIRSGLCPKCSEYGGRSPSSSYFMVNPKFDLKKLPSVLRVFILQEKAIEGALPFYIPTDLTSISDFPKFMTQKQLGAAFTVDYVIKFVKRANIKVTLASKMTDGELLRKYGSI